MSRNELDHLLRTLARQRPFRPYLLEFVSGSQLSVRHPEAIRRRDDVYIYLGPGGDYRLFAPASVSHLLPPSR